MKLTFPLLVPAALPFLTGAVPVEESPQVSNSPYALRVGPRGVNVRWDPNPNAKIITHFPAGKTTYTLCINCRGAPFEGNTCWYDLNPGWAHANYVDQLEVVPPCPIEPKGGSKEEESEQNSEEKQGDD